MSKTTLVRTKLTESEWLRLRKMALDLKTPVSALVTDAIREQLLKGVKP